MKLVTALLTVEYRDGNRTFKVRFYIKLLVIAIAWTRTVLKMYDFLIATSMAVKAYIVAALTVKKLQYCSGFSNKY